MGIRDGGGPTAREKSRARDRTGSGRHALTLGLLAAVAAASTQAQTPPSALNPLVEEQRQQERERALRQQQERKVDARSRAAARPETRQLPEHEAPCFRIDRIVLAGERADDFRSILGAASGEGGSDSPVGRCLGTEGIDIVLARLQQAVVARGYVTTRVLAASQDLSRGTLTATLVPGRVAAIRLAESSQGRTSIAGAIPARPGELLELRDIEQGLENLQRVPTAEADIQIEPSKAVNARPGDSDLVVRYSQRLPLRFTLSLDDGGTESTGKTQTGATVAWDNPLGLNDLFYVSLNHDAFNHAGQGTSGQTVHYSVPQGYWLLGATASQSRYHQRVHGADHVINEAYETGQSVTLAKNSSTILGGSASVAGIDGKKNSFSTGGSLTMSDLQNVSRSEGSSYAVNGSVGLGYTTATNSQPTSSPQQGQQTAPLTASAGRGNYAGSSQGGTTRSGISGIAGEQGVRTGDPVTSGVLVRDWDTQTIVRDVQAQAQITREFNEKAPAALATYARSQTQAYERTRNQLNVARNQLDNETDPDNRSQLADRINSLEQALMSNKDSYENWKDGGPYRAAANILITAISGASTTAMGVSVTRETLTWAAMQMRQSMIEDSKKFPGICDAQNNCLDNKSGVSAGVGNDGFKLAGSRVDVDALCDEGRCLVDEITGTWKRNLDGKVLLKDVDENGMPIELRSLLLAHPQWRSPLGGLQSGIGQFMGLGDYAPGSFQDVLAEAYAGTHDVLNSRTWYGPDGSIRSGMTEAEKQVGEFMNKLNVLIATPFALATLLPADLFYLIENGTRK